jgi:stage V sporulation protein R
MSSKFFHGSSLLMGDNTVPGVQLSKELKEYIPKILQACRDWGLDFYPTVVQLLTYDEISEVAAYGGFPVRFPHWSFGMEYEELQRGYEFGGHKIYEMVVNCNPCYIYNLASNTLADHLTVVAHATGHNDFFKNNIHFSATDTNMMNKMANHSARIRNYMSRWGKERVTEFLDHVMRLETLIDGSDAWTDRVIKDRNIRDERKYNKPQLLNVDKQRLYMEPFINTTAFRKKQNEDVHERDIADEIGLFKEPTKNILGFIRDNAPLKPWQADIVSMLYEEAIYFFPQRQTKVGNEGWASLTDSVIMAEQGFISLGQKSDDCGIVEYADHKMGVLGGKYSMNPYKLGFYLFSDIRERWDKGRFGQEYEECTDMHKKENWDTGAMLGKEKIFEVRKYYDDLTMIHEFFTEEFCRKQEYFHWKHYPNGEYRLESRDYQKIKKGLMQRHVNGGLPDIRLMEPNYGGRGIMMLQHFSDGRPLHDPYIGDVLSSIRFIWNNDVILSTNSDDGKERVYWQRANYLDITDRSKFDKSLNNF